MGSFSVACGMSGLTIVEGDKVGIQILAPNNSPFAKLDGVMPDSFHSPSDLMMPYLPPFYGEYADYGGRRENSRIRDYPVDRG